MRRSVRSLLEIVACALLGVAASAQVQPPNPPPSFPPQVGGQWGPVFLFPHVPVSIANLPDGRILSFASNERNTFDDPFSLLSTNDEFTHAAVWDPRTGSFVEVPHPSHDMFCASLVTLEDGSVFVSGGRNEALSPWTSLFDFHSNRWIPIQNMNRGRWYPTSVYLPTGQVFTAGGAGGGPNPELWSPSSGWKLLTGIDLTTTVLSVGDHDGSQLWPLLQLDKDGTIFHHGAVSEMNKIDPFGGPSQLGTITSLGPHNRNWFPDEGVSVFYDEGKILVAGGSVSSTVDTSVASAFTIDVNGPAPVVAAAASMNFPRQLLNEVLLPTGDVLVVGGNTTGAKGTDDFSVRNAEVFDPDTNRWTLLNAQVEGRTYHSTALLLPDARVLSAGGGLAGNPAVDHWNGELFSPPYLFDASGALAARPVITNAPSIVRVGRKFTVHATPGLSGFSMVRMSATTHTTNTDQRFLRPQVSEKSSGTYELDLADNVNVLVPGYWMVFAMKGNVPSIAKVIQVVRTGTPRGPPIDNLRTDLGAPVLYQVEVEDPDGNALTFSGSGLPTGLSINASTGVVQGTATQAGVFGVAITASDGTENGVIAFPWVVSDARSEVGTVTVSQSGAGQWHLVQLDNVFKSPVVVMGPPTRNDAAPTTVRVRNVTSSSFEFQLDEWSYLDGVHGAERLSYVVVEAGEYRLSSGRALLAGRTTGVDFDNPRTQPFASGAFSQTPLVLAQVATASGSGDAVTPRVQAVSASSFTVRIQRQEGSQWVQPEEVHWIALEPGAIPGVLSSAISGAVVDEAPESISFGQVFSAAPQLLASLQTSSDLDPAALRQLGATTSGVQLVAEEEQAADLEVDHADEVVGWVAVSPAAAEIALQPLFNRAPVIVRPLDQSSASGSSASLLLAAADADGDSLTFSAVELPPGLTLNASTGAIQGTPSAPGVFAVSVTARDPSGATDSADFLWSVAGQLTIVPFASPPKPVGASVSYTAQTNGAGALQYRWDFGDGSSPPAPSSSPSVSHAFAQPGRYVVTLTVTAASGASKTHQFVQNVHAPLTAARPSASSGIVHDPVGQRVWVVNPDGSSIGVINATTNSLVGEVAVGAGPRTLGIAADGRVWVACKDADRIDVVSPSTLAVVASIGLPRGSSPHGLVFAPGGAIAFVALEGTGNILRLDGVTRAQLASQQVGVGFRHLTVSGDGTKLFATRFVTPPLPGEATAAPGTQGGGQVQQLTAASLALGPLVVLAHSNAAASERSGPGVPNYLGALAISPDGLSAAVPSKQDNIRRGTRRSGQPLTHDSTVRAITSRLSLQTGQENLAGRIDHDDASVASAAAFDAYGAYLFSALEGNRTVAVLEAYSGGQLNRALVGRAPQALALSADGSRLYVQNFMDRTVTVLDLSRLRDFDDSALPVVATIPTTGSERLSAQVLRGKQFFYDAADPRLALQGYMACAACHNDGGSDGRTWDFTQFGEGLRNTIGLKGHGVGQGRLHWTANFDEVQDFEGQIRNFAGGTGLMSDAAFFSGTVSQPLGSAKAGLSADLDALAAYVQSLTATGASPHRNQDGSRTTQGEAGRALFVGAGCASCHAGAPFTDSQAGGMHDVGTLQPTSGSFAALDTPTLRGVWATAPYLHDGSAATLSQAVQRHTGVVFDATQLASVAAYLLQIDDRESSAADTAPPGSVTGLTATAVSTTQINLSWASATDDVGVTGYRVERCQGAGCSNFTQIAAPSGSSYSDIGRTANTSYSYRVKAADAAGNVSTSYSAVATAVTPAAPDTTPPGNVATLTATAAKGKKISLSWPAATDNVGVSGYRVERCQGVGCTSFAQIATPTGTSYLDNPRANPTSVSYRYRVKAADAAGNVSVSYSPVATVVTDLK